MKKTILCLFLGLLLKTSTNAGNLLITAVNATATDVTFTISMQYSWNVVGVPSSPNNWDAAWVFIKYADCTSGVLNWQHLPLSINPADHSVTGGVLQVDPVADGMGVFIRRSAPGSNTTVPITGNVSLKMNPALASSNYQFKVFGIEMVSIPAGNFQIGDGWSSGTFNSIDITNALQTGGIATASVTLGGTGTTVGTLPATYPMGYNNFYCMKYNITTQEWLDFFNTISYDAQAANVHSGSPSNPIGTNNGTGTSIALTISVQGSALTVPKTPATYTSATAVNTAVYTWKFAAFLAFMDWAALRPMTTMEFEKLSRGTLPRVQGEFVWGTSGAGGAGPGLATNRVTACASYYGVLYLSQPNYAGQLVVNTTNQASDGGSAYTGALGDGTLSAAGTHNVANWPHITNVGGGAGMKVSQPGTVSYGLAYNSVVSYLYPSVYWAYPWGRAVRQY